MISNSFKVYINVSSQHCNLNGHKEDFDLIDITVPAPGTTVENPASPQPWHTPTGPPIGESMASL